MSNYYLNLIKSNENVQLDINKTLQKTYILLSLTIFFSAFISFLSIKANVQSLNFFTYILSFICLLFLINYFKNTFLGIFFVFIFTGFIGYSSGPILSKFLSIRYGKEIIFYSLFLSGFIFFMSSFYVIFTKKNFEFLNSFLYIGFFVIIFFLLLSYFIKLPYIYLVISGMIIIFSSMSILYDLSNIVNSGEKNYVFITLSLYLNIYNIFISLLNIFGFLSNRD